MGKIAMVVNRYGESYKMEIGLIMLVNGYDKIFFN